MACHETWPFSSLEQPRGRNDGVVGGGVILLISLGVDSGPSCGATIGASVVPSAALRKLTEKGGSSWPVRLLDV
jgi:hypothetical protein